MTISNDTPTYAVPFEALVPVSDHLKTMTPIPPSRMFLINKSLKVYTERNPGKPIFDASQGDGGASLPGVPQAILDKALPNAAAPGHCIRHAVWHGWVPADSG